MLAELITSLIKIIKKDFLGVGKTLLTNTFLKVFEDHHLQQTL